MSCDGMVRKGSWVSTASAVATSVVRFSQLAGFRGRQRASSRASGGGSAQASSISDNESNDQCGSSLGGEMLGQDILTGRVQEQNDDAVGQGHDDGSLGIAPCNSLVAHDGCSSGCNVHGASLEAGDEPVDMNNGIQIDECGFAVGGSVGTSGDGGGGYSAGTGDSSLGAQKNGRRERTARAFRYDWASRARMDEELGCDSLGEMIRRGALVLSAFERGDSRVSFSADDVQFFHCAMERGCAVLAKTPGYVVHSSLDIYLLGSVSLVYSADDEDDGGDPGCGDAGCWDLHSALSPWGSAPSSLSLSGSALSPL